MLYPTEKELAKFDINDFAKILEPAIPLMKKEEQEALLWALDHARYKEDYWFIYQYFLHPEIWRMPMVSIDTFIEDDFYLGKMTKRWQGVYPLLRKVVRDLMIGNYNEASLVCWLGSWKSFISSLTATYVTHHLLCLRNPHHFYKLVKDKPIGIMNMGLTATQALKVVFESIKTFISGSDFFMQMSPKIGASGVIKFERESIELISGNSKVTTQLGFNLFCAILDEAAFYYEEANTSSGNTANNEKTNVAQGLYEGLKGRISSRFGTEGLIMMISSPRTVSDYIMSKLSDASALDKNGKKAFKNIYGIQFPTWKVKDPKVYDWQGTFFFNSKDNTIIEDSLEEIEKLHPVNKLSDPEFDYARYVWEIPESFKTEFIKNPNKAKRDIGAHPSEAIEWFLIPERVFNAFDTTRPDPVIGNGQYKFPERPLRTQYYLHIDIGLNKNGTGDFTGFVMWHADGWEFDEATKEKRLKIHIDLIERIGIKEWEQEVAIADIRERIYTLKEMWYRISLVTLDQFQSKEMIQTLTKKGIRSEYLSVDRIIDPYNMLKEAIYEKRISMYYNEHLYKELIQLEEVTIGSHTKVDHPKTGSKDISDALAGCVYNIVTHTPYSSTMMATDMSNSIDQNMKEHIREKYKVREIEIKQRMVDRQREMEEKIVARMG